MDREQKKIHKGYILSASSLIAAMGYYATERILEEEVSYDANKLRYLNAHLGKSWQDMAGLKGGKVPIRAIYLNAVKGFETSLGGIPATLQIFNTGASKLFSNQSVVFSENIHKEHLGKFSEYYTRLTGVNPAELDLNRQTFEFAQSKLYLVEKNAAGSWQRTRTLVEHADLDVLKTPFGDQVNYSRFAQAYQNVVGAKSKRFKGITPSNQEGATAFNFFVSGGQSKFGRFGRRAHAIGIDAFKGYLRTLDDPFALFSETLDTFGLGGAESKKVLGAGSKVLEALKLRNKFGVGGFKHLEGTLPQLLKRHLSYGVPRILGAYMAYKAVNRVLAETTPISGGLSGIFAKGYQTMAMGYSYMSQALGLTQLRRKQEQIAPGSSNFGAVAAFPLAGIITGGMASGLGWMAQSFGNDPDLLAKRFAKTRFGLGEQIDIIGKKVDHFFGKAGSKSGFQAILNRIIPKTATRTRQWATIGGLIGAAMSLPFLPGALGAKNTPEEQKRIFRGEKLVPIRGHAHWETGMGAFKGEEIQAFQPHWTKRILDDTRAKSIYGDYYGHPFKRFFKSLVDPYYLEKMHAKKGDRFYDVWGPGDLGLGFIGKIYKHTIGKLFKPPVYFYSNEEQKRRIQENDPYSFKNAVNEISHSATEAIGLKGFLARTVLKKFTGRDEIFKPDERVVSSSSMTSMGRQFWDTNIGGGLGNTEALRRLLGRQSGEIENIYSERETNLPTWLPDRLRRGAPQEKIKAGDQLLSPVSWVEAHPELKGIDPEQYSAAYRLQILENVAPYGKEKFRALRETEQTYTAGKLSSGELNAYSQYLEMQRAKEEENKKWEYKKPEGFIGHYWDAIGRIGRANPMESLLPVSPVHKFVPARDPLEEYRDFMVLDAHYKSWEHPIKGFVTPFINKTLNLLTLGNYVPPDVENKGAIEEKFQRLQFVKNTMIQQKLLETQDPEAKALLKSAISKTMYDVNPYEKKDKVLKYLPRAQRRYFDAFANETDPDRQERIKKYTPEYLHEFIQAQWDKKSFYNYQDAAMRGEALDKMQDEEMIRLMAKIASRNLHVPSGTGLLVFNSDPNEIERLQRIRLENEIAADPNLPSEEWTGWQPDVSLRGVKAKFVDQLGYNYHDFDLWAADESAGMDMPSTVTNPINIDAGVVNNSRHRVQKIVSNLGITDLRMSAAPYKNSRTNIDVEVDTKAYVKHELSQGGGGGFLNKEFATQSLGTLLGHLL